MPKQFDPYHRWLGIPRKDQPPDHYRLLAIDRFEADSDVIADAADRQMAYLRTQQAGRYGELATRLLNEIAAARVCLLNPEKRRQYDEGLRREPAGDPNATAAGSAEESNPDEGGDSARPHAIPVPPPVVGSELAQPSFRALWPWALAPVAVGLLIVAWWAMRDSSEETADAESLQVVSRSVTQEVNTREKSHRPEESSTTSAEPPAGEPAKEKLAALLESKPRPAADPGEKETHASLSTKATAADTRANLAELRRSVVTIIADVGDERRLISGLILDGQGTVVAPFRPLHEAGRVDVRLADGAVVQPHGYLLVDPSRNLILLRIEAPAESTGKLPLPAAEEDFAVPVAQLGDFVGGVLVDSRGTVLGMSAREGSGGVGRQAEYLARAPDIRALQKSAGDVVLPWSQLKQEPHRSPPGKETSRGPVAKPEYQLAQFDAHQASVNSLAAAPDGSYVASCGADGKICIIGIHEDRIVHELVDDVGQFHDVAVSGQGRYLVAGCGRGETLISHLQIWHVGAGTPLKQIACKHFDAWGVAVSPDSRLIAATHRDGAVSVRSSKAKLVTQHVTFFARNTEQKILCAAFSPDTRYIAFGGEKGELTVYRLGSRGGSLSADKQTAHEGAIFSLAFDPAGEYLLTVGGDGKLRQWRHWSEEKLFAETKQIEAHREGVNCVVVTKSGKQWATGGADGKIRVWNADGGLQTVLPAHAGGVTGLAYLPDERLASGGADGQVRVWSLARLPRIEEGEDSAVPSFASPPKGQSTRTKIAPPKTAPKTTRRELPAQTQLAAAEQHFQAAYGTKLAQATDFPARWNLAKGLLARAEQEESTARRFVLLEQALGLAAESGSLSLADQSLELLASEFELQIEPYAAEAYQRLAQTVRAAQQRAKLIRNALERMQQAVRADRYDAAERLLTAAENASRGVVGPLSGRVERHRSWLAHARLLWERYAKVESDLAGGKATPEAHLSAGKYFCFNRGHWRRGLEHLAQGSDGRLAKVAAIDWSQPAAREKQLDLAKRWKALAAEAPPAETELYLAAAKFWLRRAHVEHPSDNALPADVDRTLRIRSIDPFFQRTAP